MLETVQTDRERERRPLTSGAFEREDREDEQLLVIAFPPYWSSANSFGGSRNMKPVRNQLRSTNEDIQRFSGTGYKADGGHRRQLAFRP